MKEYSNSLKQAVNDGTLGQDTACKFWVVRDEQFPQWCSFRIECKPIGKP